MEFPNYLDCCRFCLNLLEISERVEFEDEVKKSFQELIGFEVRS